MTKKTNIKSLSDDDRPREKLMAKGSAALSNAELIAILIGSGNADQNAVELCRTILQDHQNDITKISRLTLPELQQYKGIGPAKAITIVAALELGRRRQISESSEVQIVSSSEDAYKILRPHLMDLAHEEFWVLMMNRRNQVIHQQKFSQGGTTGTVVDNKLITKSALLHNAEGLIISHNHPSGNLKASKADMALTEKLKAALLTFDIKLLDHLIITKTNYFSFADNGLL